MVTETNLYASQQLINSALKEIDRVGGWKNVTAIKRRTFIEVYVLTWFIDFPTKECYWNKDSLYYHLLFYNIPMTYKRIALILFMVKITVVEG